MSLFVIYPGLESIKGFWQQLPYKHLPVPGNEFAEFPMGRMGNQQDRRLAAAGPVQGVKLHDQFKQCEFFTGRGPYPFKAPHQFKTDLVGQKQMNFSHLNPVVFLKIIKIG